jgi:HB1, ASXL, restriction endonuclease HTH domain
VGDVLVDLLRSAEAELLEIRGRRAELERAERTSTEKVAHLRALVDLEGSAGEGTETAESRPNGSSVSDMRVQDIAAEILSERGPLHYQELWDEVARRGGVLLSGNPAAVLLTRISRDDRFRRSKPRGVYDLALGNDPRAPKVKRRRRRKTGRRGSVRIQGATK